GRNLRGRVMRVLCVDDNALTADALAAYLSLEGHTARFEGDGLAALTYLDAPGEPLPDVIVLDLCMPGMDGEEFLRHVATQEKWSDIPVILTTAASPDEQAHVRYRWPGMRLLSKPFDPDELLDVLKEIDHARAEQ